jgi:probable F420-dependent oxidoreductase
MASVLDFGIALSGRGALATRDALVKLAQKAEVLRYSSIFVTDHIVIPVTNDSHYPYSASGKVGSDWAQGYLEPLALMSYLAGATKRIRIGTSVLIIPYRNPVFTAKTLATLDVLSGGRIILGAGVGWMKEEFEALQAPPFSDRGRITDEYIELMRACWTGKEPVEFKGPTYRLNPVSALPKPAQKGGIPVWTGGHTAAALQRAGELADGWHPIALRPPGLLHPPEYEEKAGIVRDWARRAGRKPADVTMSLRVPLDLAARNAKPGGGDRMLFSGTAAQVIADLRTYQALGVTHFVFDPAPADLRGRLAMMERFAEDVRPRVLRAPR